jgi:hypothetical protein
MGDRRPSLPEHHNVEADDIALVVDIDDESFEDLPRLNAGANGLCCMVSRPLRTPMVPA